LLAATVVLVGCGESTRLDAPLARKATPASNFELVSTIAFTSTRDGPNAELYLMDADGTNQRRLTNDSFGQAFGALSPDGKKIVFDSNELSYPDADRPGGGSDLFVMASDGSEKTWLVRGSSASWSPDGKNVAFHASASGVGIRIKADPGAATTDSDIFTINVDDALSGAAGRVNITNSADAIDDDADWSPDGQRIAYTSHLVTDNPITSNTAEIYTIAPTGGTPTRLTNNSTEERAPSWSPDGSRICYMCRHPGLVGPGGWEICVMNADGSGQTQITDNTALDGTPTWSPDGSKIVFHRIVGGLNQLFDMNPDGSGQTQLTTPPGHNLYGMWGQLRVHAQ